MTEIKIEVDTRQAQDAIGVLEKLAQAANLASEALAKLDSQAHGGVKVTIVGAMAICTVKPVKTSAHVPAGYPDVKW